MLELVKLLIDGVVLRDSARKGLLTWRVIAWAIAFVLLLYGTGLPATLLYQAHPQYKPLFIAAIVFDILLFVVYLFFAIRWYLRQLALQRARGNTPSESATPDDLSA